MSRSRNFPSTRLPIPGRPGLLQKYYLLRFRSGEHGGVYVWDSAASMERFMASGLNRTICDAPFPAGGVGA